MIMDILLVEDQKSMQTLIKFNLVHSGYTVKVVSNGVDALQQIQSFQPKLIISDVMMPVMDGIEFRKKLLLNNTWREIPFVFLTAKAQVTDVLNVKNLYVNEYMTKPFEIEELLRIVSQYVSRENN